MESAIETHYSVQEVAKMWHFGEDKIRLLFKNEPGVLHVGIPERLHKRGYFTLRIPQSVLVRVHASLRKAA